MDETSRTSIFSILQNTQCINLNVCFSGLIFKTSVGQVQDENKHCIYNSLNIQMTTPLEIFANHGEFQTVLHIYIYLALTKTD